MDELSPGPVSPALPERVGDTLRAAREALGLTLGEVAARTRVPLRHLEAIELNDYAGLPSPTYATGFAKAYARAVGADEVEIARGVRGELAGVTRQRPEYRPYEATDPSRVPSKGVTTIALGLALVVAALAALYFGTGLFRGGADPATPAPAVLTAEPAFVPASAPTPSAGQVLVTATDEVWVRIYDADGKTLHQGVLQAGQRFDVPDGARDPMINVGRPDKLRITVNGSLVSGLVLGDQPIKDVRVSAAALSARAAGETTPSAAASSAAPRAANPATAPTPARSEPRARAQRSDPPALSETQRANLNAAAATAPIGNTQ